MARPPRVVLPGTTYHVLQRGVNRSDIFRAPLDYRLYLDALKDAALEFEVSVVCYALMTNHVHLMLSPRTATGIASTMQAIGRRYVYHFNRTYTRSGGLFEGRYRSLPIETERYWFTCVRYVEMNPVRAGVVERPEQYRWSSYRAHVFGSDDPVLSPHPLYLRLGATAEARRTAWRQGVDLPLKREQIEELRYAVRKGRRSCDDSEI